MMTRTIQGMEPNQWYMSEDLLPDGSGVVHWDDKFYWVQFELTDNELFESSRVEFTTIDDLVQHIAKAQDLMPCIVARAILSPVGHPFLLFRKRRL